ncbi:MAG: ribosome recycling factor [Ruminococcaceae bacterium]|nr:ribosome recycling factor [Oscillospiraceae bacterium]
MANARYEQFETKMKKSVSVMEADLAAVRAGRANPAILDKVTVEYYGVPSPLTQIASVSVPDARTIMIQPWDASILGEVEKAILKSDIGITPNNDGKALRLNFPPLTEERRKELVKQVQKRAEDGKVAIRSIRRDALEFFKAQKKNSEITEDDLKVIEKDVQDLTDRYVKEVEAVASKKEKEILEV